MKLKFMGRGGDMDISEVVDAKKQVANDYEQVDGHDITNWENKDRFKRNDSDTRSVDQEDVSEVKSLKQDEITKPVMRLLNLFREEDDDVGLVDLCNTSEEEVIPL